MNCMWMQILLPKRKKSREIKSERNAKVEQKQKFLYRKCHAQNAYNQIQGNMWVMMQARRDAREREQGRRFFVSDENQWQIFKNIFREIDIETLTILPPDYRLCYHNYCCYSHCPSMINFYCHFFYDEPYFLLYFFLCNFFYLHSFLTNS